MKRIKITVLLILLCVLAGCSPKDTSLRAYCTESQQEFLDQSLEELPVALTYHHNDNILGRYETTDEEIISEILQALRETTIVSKAFSGSTDSRILEFETADGDTCLFWLFIFVFQTRGSLGFGFICSLSPSTQNSTLYFRNFRIFFRAAAMDFCTA